ncbi:MAG: zf-HC2 domain-containing protein [Candidatus Aminicenantales bacterium]
MRCKDIELLIIDSAERKLNEEEQRTVEHHTSYCTNCRQFQKDFLKIELSLKNLTSPSLPETVEKKTREACLTELRIRQEASAPSSLKTHFSGLHPLIWAALFVLIALTISILIPAIKDLILEKPLNFKTAAVLTLIFQNTVMLLIAPLIFRKFYSQKRDFRLI